MWDQGQTGPPESPPVGTDYDNIMENMPSVLMLVGEFHKLAHKSGGIYVYPKKVGILEAFLGILRALSGA